MAYNYITNRKMPQGNICHKVKAFHKDGTHTILQSKHSNFDMEHEHYIFCMRRKKVPKRIISYQVLIKFFEVYEDTKN